MSTVKARAGVRLPDSLPWLAPAYLGKRRAEYMMRTDETMIPRMDVIDEFPDGVPEWMHSLPVEEVRPAMEHRRNGYTRLGLDPGEDGED